MAAGPTCSALEDEQRNTPVFKAMFSGCFSIVEFVLGGGRAEESSFCDNLGLLDSGAISVFSHQSKRFLYASTSNCLFEALLFLCVLVLFLARWFLVGERKICSINFFFTFSPLRDLPTTRLHIGGLLQQCLLREFNKIWKWKKRSRFLFRDIYLEKVFFTSEMQVSKMTAVKPTPSFSCQQQMETGRYR